MNALTIPVQLLVLRIFNYHPLAVFPAMPFAGSMFLIHLKQK